MARRNRPTEADNLFAAYLDSRGVPYCREPPWSEVFGIDVAATPDFLIEPDGLRAVCEVKDFDRTKVWDQLLASPGRALPVAPEDDWGPVESKMRQAAYRQLRHFQGVGVPLVIVLANTGVSDVTLDFDTVAPAMFGDDQQTVVVGPEAPLGQEGVRTFGGHGAFSENRDGSIENAYPYVSAVVTVHPLSSDRQRVEVYDLSGNPTPPGFQSTPLPRRLFDAPHDRWYGFPGDGTFGEIT